MGNDVATVGHAATTGVLTAADKITLGKTGVLGRAAEH